MPFRMYTKVTHTGPGSVHVKTYVRLHPVPSPEQIQQENQKTIDEVEKKRKQEKEEKEKDA